MISGDKTNSIPEGNILIAKLENFIHQIAQTETPLKIEELSDFTAYASLVEPNRINVAFLWDNENLALKDRTVNPLEVNVVQPILAFMKDNGFPYPVIHEHNYDTGMTSIDFSSRFFEGE